MLKKPILFFLVLLTILFSCKKDDDNNDSDTGKVPTLSEVSSSFHNDKGLAEFDVNILETNGEITQKGFFIILGHPDIIEPNLEAADTTIIVSSADNKITREMDLGGSRLIASNQCGVMFAFATNASGTAYLKLTGQGVICLGRRIVTIEPSNIEATSASSGGRSPWNDWFKGSRGIVYSTNDNPTVSNQDDFYLQDSIGPVQESFNLEMTDLTPATTYYVRATYREGPGIFYGKTYTFQTKNPITISDPYDITSTNSKLDVTIQPWGELVDFRGVVYSPEPDPDINNLFTIDGAGTGTFVSEITQLLPNTTYYVKGYAAIADGSGSKYVYSEEKTFKTLP